MNPDLKTCKKDLRNPFRPTRLRHDTYWDHLIYLAGANQGQRTRLLLKVLAVSDLVIYRTHADRLHDDLFKFLGDASDAYLKHFTRELKATTARCGLDVPLSTLGPAVVIFHETVHTKLLGSGGRTTTYT